MVAESPARPLPLYVERARRQMRRGASRSRLSDGFESEIDPTHARARGERSEVTPALDSLELEAESGAWPPRRERRAKPGAGYVELRRLPTWTYSGHAPVRLSRYQAYVLARIENVSLALLIGPQPVPVSGRTTPRARSARRRSRTRRSRSRDPDPDHPSRAYLSAAANIALELGLDELALELHRMADRLEACAVTFPLGPRQRRVGWLGRPR